MPGSGLHRYIVVIFEQQRQLLLSSDDDDDDDTLSSSYEGILKSLSTSKRSEFDLKVIAEELHLKLSVQRYTVLYLSDLERNGWTDNQ